MVNHFFFRIKLHIIKYKRKSANSSFAELGFFCFKMLIYCIQPKYLPAWESHFVTTECDMRFPSVKRLTLNLFKHLTYPTKLGTLNKANSSASKVGMLSRNAHFSVFNCSGLLKTWILLCQSSAIFLVHNYNLVTTYISHQYNRCHVV